MARPSNKIIALIVTAVLIIGSASYEKYFDQPAANSAVLSYDGQPDQEDAVASSTLNSAAALENYDISSDSAFTNSNFSSTDNLTDRFAKTAFSTYVDMVNNGSDDDTAEESVVNDLSSQASAVGDNQVKYGLSDILTFSDSDTAKVKDYGNQLASVNEQGLQFAVSNQAKISNSPQTLANEYALIADQISKIPTPSSQIGVQLEIANAYYDLSQSIPVMADYQTDPLKGLTAMKQGKNDEDTLNTVYGGLSTYFKTNGIIFNSNEPGAFWNNFVAPTSTDSGATDDTSGQ